MDMFEYCFRGERNYVHGTDIYDSISMYLERQYSIAAVGRLDLWFHRMSSHQMEGYILAKNEPLPPRPCVVCKFEIGATVETLYLLETELPIRCRLPYEEERIVERLKLFEDKKEIQLDESLPFSLIQIIVPLNKVLLQNLFHGVEGKWVFSRLKLDRPLPASFNSDVIVSFDRGLGVHLTRSRINIDSNYYGEIFFSLVQGGQV